MRSLPATIPEASTVPAVKPTLPAAADRNPALVYLARLGPGSRRTMRQALDTVAAIASHGQHDALTLPWSQLRYQHTQAIRSVLTEHYAAATANKTLAALRGVLREAWRLDQMSADAYQRAVDLRPAKASTLPRGRALTPGELRALVDTCTEDPTPAGGRDAAILALLYGAGLRRAEAVALDLDDYDPESGAVTVRQGKGNKERVSYVSGGAGLALDAWLRVRGQEGGALLVPIDKAGQLTIRAMSAQAIYKVLLKRAAQAGVARLSPHDLRRSFVSDLFDAGADSSSIQQLAGHASISTTTRYDRRGEAAKRKASMLLHFPCCQG